MKTKFCGKCQTTRPVSDFAKNRSKKDGLQATCKVCRKKYWANEYSRNRDAYLKRSHKQMKRGQDRLKELKKNSFCLVCGENEFCCLDFHHLDPKEKDRDLAKAKYFSDKRFLEEVEKCVCLCANCHRKFHAGLVKLDII
jgi:hypothetical protein